MAHVVFLRSPHAHAKIVAIDAVAARRMPGVIAVVTGRELATVITPWVGVLSHLKGLKSAPQHAIAIDHVCWQGEAVAAVVATSRAVAEDAAEIVSVEYQRTGCGDRHAHRARSGKRRSSTRRWATISRSSGSSMSAPSIRRLPIPTRCWKRNSCSDGIPASRWSRAPWSPTGTSPETRLTIYQGTQAPHMVQNIAALHLGLAGLPGSRGLQGCRRLVRHQGPRLRRRNGDLCAVETAAPADQIRRRPGRKLQHRHPRPRPSLQGPRSASSATGPSWRSRSTISPASVPIRCIRAPAPSRPTRSSTWSAAPTLAENYRARARVVFQNKNVMCQYRGVGHPIACSVTEGLVDLAASKIGMDPVEIRRRNLVADDAYPCASPSGLKFELLSHHAAIDKLIGDDGL